MTHKGPYTLEEIKRRALPVIEQYGIAKVFLFGSYARGDAKDESDIDVCIEEGRPMSLFDLSGFYLDLQEHLEKNVDVVTMDGIKGDFRENIEKEWVRIYG
ncbi:MAG: nucleotidyltransferase family protein [Tannerella sp.]|jgi:predicted nucleotidyltransferase|nr:nucleotidyltransferase family protein [Tannerella sp.]